ncbi:hypothetical protein LAZ67_13001498 [Cordylochernes scorpioides]|uniref:Uncharacterized protein n=1 Tax=Cordylochernes scorpioides TaxID=51811 RepID=A0ABY6L4B5_9ARAC|nr:hypothetical protein LAZ67_13001498 [Cordylochernes scorpioides]
MVKGKEDNVSLDRLKPAYLLKESYPEDDDLRQQPEIQQDLQPSKARTQKIHFEEPQRTRSDYCSGRLITQFWGHSGFKRQWVTQKDEVGWMSPRSEASAEDADKVQGNVIYMRDRD